MYDVMLLAGAAAAFVFGDLAGWRATDFFFGAIKFLKLRGAF